MTVRGEYITRDVSSQCLRNWDISAVSTKVVLDVRTYDTLSLSGREQSGPAVTWDDIINVQWSLHSDGSDAGDFPDGAESFDNTTPNCVVEVGPYPYVVLSPAGSPDSGTTVEVTAWAAAEVNG